MRFLSLGFSLIACVALTSSCDSDMQFGPHDGSFIAPSVADSSVVPGAPAGAMADAAAGAATGGGTLDSGAPAMDASGASMGNTDSSAPGPTAEASVADAGGQLGDAALADTGASDAALGDAGDSGAPIAADIDGCSGSKLIALPTDTGARGPWPVGQRTVKFGRFSAVEVMYPAKPGSEQGKQPLSFDMRQFLPEKERSKVPDAEATIVSQQTYADLPLDDAHGPYPVVIFVHGTASFRIGSFSTQALWASRGFVVMAADHPNLYLADYLGANGCNLNVPALNLSGDVDSEIAALTSASGELSFFAGHIDMKRLALSGHSAGAYNVAQFSAKPGVAVVMPLAGTRAVTRSATLKSILYVSGIDDNVLAYKPPQKFPASLLYPGTDTDAYNGSAGPPDVKKRLVGISGGGHLTVTDLCRVGPANKSDLEVSKAHGVCGVQSILDLKLADCGTIAPAKGNQIVNDVTTAVLEETLHCQDRAAAISAIKSRYPDVGDFHEAVK